MQLGNEHANDENSPACQLFLPDPSAPDLRIITRAKFPTGTVIVPRSDDPLSLAREYLRDQIAPEEIHEPQIGWSARRKPGSREIKRTPGWTSTVKFQTEPTPQPISASYQTGN